MNQLERVSRTLCCATGFAPDDVMANGELRWRLPKQLEIAQAVIDAMQEDIAEADRAAREECAELCSDVANQHIRKGPAYGDRVLGAIDCEHRIRETVVRD